MECLAHVLANAYKVVVMDVQYDDERVDTEVTRRNMQRCINWKKIAKGGKGFGYSTEECGTSL